MSVAPTLVLLHGFTGAPASWAAVERALPPDTPRHALALLGHAGAPYTATCWEQEIDRLAETIANLPRPVHLCGYSLGGRVALGLLVRHPGLAASATLVGAGAGISSESARHARALEDERRASQLEHHGLEAFVDAWEREPIFATQAHLPSDVRAAHRTVRMSHDPRGLAASLRILGQGAMPDLWPTLASISVPTTLVVGALDDKLLPITARMADALPDAERVVVPDAGHDITLEQPDALARLLPTAGRR